MTASTATGGPLALLLIEDDDDDALIVSDLLRDERMDVALTRGRTLGEGLAQLSDPPARIDCILLDLRLPDVDGLEAVGRIRAIAPGIAVIVLTGLDDEAAGEAAVEAGAQDYLVKGRTDAGLLVRAIRYAVGRRHAEDVQSQLRLAEARADENARLERGLVPHPLIMSPSVWIASSYLPGRQRAALGGDFYDVVEDADGCLHAIIGDVSGRGPDEAALGAGLRIAWRALTLAGAGGGRVMHTLDAMIEAERQDPGTFATLCTLRIDPGTRGLTLHRAGHPAPMIIGPDAVESLPLDHGGPPIGMFSSAEWPDARYELPDDWSILLYTDGAIEGRDGTGGLLGEDGLRDLVRERVSARRHWRSDPDRLLSELVDRTRELNGEPFSDDVALLALGVR
jgi:serine phosphatase RsbU (regulator of sigma subunit)